MEYPSNSHRQTDKQPVNEPKKIERVITGEVVRRKKPIRKRFMETFIGGDARTAGSFIFLDVLIPAAKEALADAMSQGFEKWIFGEARSAGRRTGRRPGLIENYTSYDRYASTSRSPSRREEPRVPSRRARASHDFDEIILATRVEAEEVIDKLFDLVLRYDVAAVSDLYDLVGVSGDYTDEKYGWTDLRGADITRVRNGYLLDLPKPELLK